MNQIKEFSEFDGLQFGDAIEAVRKVEAALLEFAVACGEAASVVCRTFMELASSIEGLEQEGFERAKKKERHWKRYQRMMARIKQRR